MSSESLKRFDERLIKMFTPPKSKARLTSFTKFYTRSIESSPDSCITPKK